MKVGLVSVVMDNSRILDNLGSIKQCNYLILQRNYLEEIPALGSIERETRLVNRTSLVVEGSPTFR